MARLASIEVRPKGVAESVRAFLGLEQKLDPELRRAMQELGERAVPIFAAVALHGSTGQLAAGIRSGLVGARVEVTAHATSTQGYDYVGVTRFGVRAARIYPSPDRQPASVVPTRRLRATGAQAALRFVIGGRVLYRRSVRGFHPTSDWRDRGLPAVAFEAHAVLDRLGRRIEVRGVA